MENNVIRKAMKEDIPALVALITETFNAGTPECINKKLIDIYSKEDMAQGFVAASINRMLVLLNHSGLIGFAVVNEGHIIEYFMINIRHQRQGNGSYFLKVLFDEPYLMRAIDFYGKDILTKCFLEKHEWEPRWKFKKKGENIVKYTYMAPPDHMWKSLNFADSQKEYIRDLW